MPSFDADQLLDDYLLNRLDSAKRQQFEAELEGNAALREQLAIRRLALQGARQSGRAALKNRLQRIHREQTQLQTSQINKRRRRIFGLSAAAAVLLLVTGFFLVRSSSMGPDSLYNQYYQTYAMNLVSRDGEVTPQWVELNEFYQQKNYAAALPLFEALLAQETKDARLLVGAGICHLELGQAEAARPYFESLLSRKDLRLQAPARWYLALSHLKTRDLKSARLLLQDLSTSTDHNYATRAKELLGHLPD